MRIGICGGGPAGLYLAVLMKRADPAHEITVFERNPPGATYGWGVVFSDESLGELRDADYETYLAIDEALVRWNAIDTYYQGTRIRSTGHGFAAIARTALLGLLRERAAALGVTVVFEHPVESLETLSGSGFDLVVGADGVRSVVRSAEAKAFGTTLSPTASKYIWYGADVALPVFTFIFTPTEFGLFQVHAYPYDAHRSTFIVECMEPAWRRAGLDTMSEEDSLAFCQDLFAGYLSGGKLMSKSAAPPASGSSGAATSGRSPWSTFVTVRNRTWHQGNVVLLGDAAHTAHFSIGSGTRLAMDDAIALAKAFVEHPGNLEAAFTAYEGERQPIVERFQEVALDSAHYFESVGRYLGFDPEQFTFNLLTRGRISHNNLEARDPALVNRVQRVFAGVPAARLVVPPPVLVPLRIGGGCRLANRVVLAPSPLDEAVDGLPAESHAVALEAAARAGAGLVVTEPVAVVSEGRVTPRSPGLWTDSQAEAWARVVERVHAAGSASGDARLALRLSHAGRRGSTLPRRRGLDRPLPAGGWRLAAPSPVPYTSRSPRPEELDAGGLESVRAAFAAAAVRAAGAGVDVLVLDLADGYLLASFLSPLSNLRTDAYGGDLAARVRFPLEVLEAVRAAWPAERPLAVRLVADDRMPGGLTPADGVELARWVTARGVTLVDVTAGHTVPDERAAADYRRMFNVGLADRVRNEAGVATIASGHITRFDEVNTILAAGRADLCVLDPRLYAIPSMTRRSSPGYDRGEERQSESTEHQAFLAWL